MLQIRLLDNLTFVWTERVLILIAAVNLCGLFGADSGTAHRRENWLVFSGRI
jgi:hypothetical protein